MPQPCSQFLNPDQPGDDGLTPRMLLESSAFHVQKTVHYPGLGHTGYLRMLEEDDVALEYRSAYDLASAYLHEECLDHFTLISNLALMVDRPDRVFMPLVRQFSKAASRTNTRGNFEMGLDFLRATFPGALSSVDDVRRELGAQPILERIRDGISAPDLDDDGAYLHFSHRVLAQQAASAALGPTFFPPAKPGEPAPMWVPPEWENLPDADVLSSVTIRLLAATGMILRLPAATDETAVREVST